MFRNSFPGAGEGAQGECKPLRHEGLTGTRHDPTQPAALTHWMIFWLMHDASGWVGSAVWFSGSVDLDPTQTIVLTGASIRETAPFAWRPVYTVYWMIPGRSL